MKKVSVIMPVYNSEKYLVNSINCLLSQTLSDLEIILVDDGSTDNSKKIISDCKAQFPNKVITLGDSINRGAGGARNLGIQKASGEYIGFMDSDDLISPQMYEKLYNAAKENDADIVDSGFFFEKQDTALLYTSDNLTGILNDKKRSDLIASGGFIVTKIFRSSLIKADSNCIFRENAILEDADFLTYLFATAKNIYNVKEIFYKYTYTQGSESNCEATQKYHHNITAAIQAIYNKTHNLPNYKKIQQAVEYEMAQMLLYGFVNSAHLEKQNYPDTLSMKKELLDLKKLFSIDFNANHYIINKFSREDFVFFQNFKL